MGGFLGGRGTPSFDPSPGSHAAVESHIRTWWLNRDKTDTQSQGLSAEGSTWFNTGKPGRQDELPQTGGRHRSFRDGTQHQQRQDGFIQDRLFSTPGAHAAPRPSVGERLFGTSGAHAAPGGWNRQSTGEQVAGVVRMGMGAHAGRAESSVKGAAKAAGGWAKQKAAQKFGGTGSHAASTQPPRRRAKPKTVKPPGLSPGDPFL